MKPTIVATSTLFLLAVGAAHAQVTLDSSTVSLTQQATANGPDGSSNGEAFNDTTADDSTNSANGIVDLADLGVFDVDILTDVNGSAIVAGDSQLGLNTPFQVTSETDFDLQFSLTGSVVPEPSPLALLSLGGLLVAPRRRRN